MFFRADALRISLSWPLFRVGQLPSHHRSEHSEEIEAFFGASISMMYIIDLMIKKIWCNLTMILVFAILMT